MNKKHSILIMSALLLLFSSCVAFKDKKTATYYYKHEKEINNTVSLYRSLYRQQALSIGFSDRQYKHVGIDIITDSVRYALNTLQNGEILRNAIAAFKYDTVAIKKLYASMHKLKCIWLGTSEFYFNGKKSDVIFLSFRSAKSGNMYLDRKYYTLIMFDPGFVNKESEVEIAKEGYTRIKNAVYYKILEQFRL